MDYVCRRHDILITPHKLSGVERSASGTPYSAQFQIEKLNPQIRLYQMQVDDETFRLRAAVI